MINDPQACVRRLPPDRVQFQVILGSLLGDGRLVGSRRGRRLEIAHLLARADYVWWKYDRLGAFAAHAPLEAGGRIAFATVAHPLFDDLAALPRWRLVELAAPLGLAVFLADIGRLQLRPEAFLPWQRDAALRAS